MTEKRVILDDSIPDLVKQKSGWMIRHWAATEQRLRFELRLNPPVPAEVDFSSPIVKDDEPSLTLHFFKDSSGPDIVVSMDERDARIAREFIEKHYG